MNLTCFGPSSVWHLRGFFVKHRPECSTFERGWHIAYSLTVPHAESPKSSASKMPGSPSRPRPTQASVDVLHSASTRWVLGRELYVCVWRLYGLSRDSSTQRRDILANTVISRDANRHSWVYSALCFDSNTGLKGSVCRLSRQHLSVSSK